MTATTPERPTRSRRIPPSPEERALADRIAIAATALRNGSDEGISIREAVELAAVQMGLT